MRDSEFSLLNERWEALQSSPESADGTPEEKTQRWVTYFQRVAERSTRACGDIEKDIESGNYAHGLGKAYARLMTLTSEMEAAAEYIGKLEGIIYEHE